MVTAMTTFLLILMALLVIGALERNKRRQPPGPRDLIGSDHHDDRDWARIKLDLIALDDRANTNHQNGPRPA